MVAPARPSYALSMFIAFAVSHISCKLGKTFCQGVLRLPDLVIVPGVGDAKSGAADMRHAEMAVLMTAMPNPHHADVGDADIDDADMDQCLQRWLRLTLDFSSFQICVMLMLGTHTGRAPAMMRYAASL